MKPGQNTKYVYRYLKKKPHRSILMTIATYINLHHDICNCIYFSEELWMYDCRNLLLIPKDI